MRSVIVLNKELHFEGFFGGCYHVTVEQMYGRCLSCLKIQQVLVK